jgi:glycerate dehydrogenase
MLNAVLLDSETLGEDISFDGISKITNLEIYKITSLSERESRCINADIIITNKVIIDKVLIDLCPKLKLICVTATGLNNIDLDYCEENGILVKNAKGYSTNSVAQQTFNLALHLLSKTNYYNNYTKGKKWQNSNTFTHLGPSITELSGKNWGIIGLGEIGGKVAEIAKAFGCNVFYHTASGKNLEREYPHLGLNELMTTCDLVSIHAPLNEFTNNLIKKEELQLMKDGAVLLNLGRGGIVNENDLVEVFSRINISVGLDVLEVEPIQANSKINSLLGNERFLLSPHIAWASLEARTRLIDLTIGNISQFIK